MSSAEGRSVKKKNEDDGWTGTVCPSAWHDCGRESGSDCWMLERDATGEGLRGTWLERRVGRMGVKPSWRLPLIGPRRFPWLTRPICSVDLKRDTALSKVAGQAGPWGCRRGL